jgi:hypothetical protein
MTSEPSKDDKHYIKLKPVTPDMLDITWDGNDATIPGTMLKIQEWITRTGHFRLFVEHGAVRIGRYTMIDDFDAIDFIQKSLPDVKRTLANACPPTPKRVTAYNLTTAAKASPYKKVDAKDAATKMPTAVVDQNAVDEEDSSLLASLVMVFGGHRNGRNAAVDAAGSGRKYIDLMLERAKKADASDRAVVMASYLKLIQKGIEGEITPEKLADFHEAYEIAESHIDAKLRQPTEAKVEMITRIALSDPAIRQLYLLDIKAKAPTTMAQAIEYVDAILKTNVRIAELDTINNGSVGAALAATRAAEDTRVAELEARVAQLAALAALSK